MGDLIALFPLGLVLMPGAPLPLHIFEPRYRQMIDDVKDSGNAFGVVALQQGVDTSRPEEVAVEQIGTLAEIMEVEPYPDGRSDLLAVGSRRFRIAGIDWTGRPYVRARVEWLEEVEGPVRARDVAAAARLCELYARALSTLTGRDPDEEEELPRDPVQLSYDVAGRLQLPQSDKQRLLAEATAASRLHTGLMLLRRETVLLRETRTIPVPAQVLRIASGLN